MCVLAGQWPRASFKSRARNSIKTSPQQQSALPSTLSLTDGVYVFLSNKYKGCKLKIKFQILSGTHHMALLFKKKKRISQ